MALLCPGLRLPAALPLWLSRRPAALLPSRVSSTRAAPSRPTCPAPSSPAGFRAVVWSRCARSLFFPGLRSASSASSQIAVSETLPVVLLSWRLDLELVKERAFDSGMIYARFRIRWSHTGRCRGPPAAEPGTGEELRFCLLARLAVV